MSGGVTPCEEGWAPVTGLCSTWSSTDPAIQQYALAFATQVIWSATGRQFGLCDVFVRPCQIQQVPLYLTYPAVPYWSAWSDASGNLSVVTPPLSAGGCCSGCACSASSVGLPGVYSITSVMLDGVALDPAAYELRGDHLVRIDGGSWPLGQDLTVASGQPNTFVINYKIGIPVPAILNMAAGVYACEVAKGRTSGTCALPNRVQSISRQGVDITLISSETYLQDGLTGFAEVDQLIHSFNPWRLVQLPRVLSLDVPGMGG